MPAIFAAEFIWFFLLSALLGISAPVFIAFDLGFLVGLALIIYAVSTWWCGYWNWAFVVDHPLDIGMFFISYVIVGLIWVYIKWGWKSRRAVRNYEDAKRVWLRNKGLGPTYDINLDQKIKDDWLHEWKSARQYHGSRHKQIPLQADEHKDWLFRHWGYWPFSMIESFFTEFLNEILITIYNRLRGSFQWISNWMAADVMKDFE